MQRGEQGRGPGFSLALPRGPSQGLSLPIPEMGTTVGPKASFGSAAQSMTGQETPQKRVWHTVRRNTALRGPRGARAGLPAHWTPSQPPGLSVRMDPPQGWGPGFSGRGRSRSLPPPRLHPCGQAGGCGLCGASAPHSAPLSTDTACLPGFPAAGGWPASCPHTGSRLWSGAPQLVCAGGAGEVSAARGCLLVFPPTGGQRPTPRSPPPRAEGAVPEPVTGFGPTGHSLSKDVYLLSPQHTQIIPGGLQVGTRRVKKRRKETPVRGASSLTYLSRTEDTSSLKDVPISQQTSQWWPTGRSRPFPVLFAVGQPRKTRHQVPSALTRPPAPSGRSTKQPVRVCPLPRGGVNPPTMATAKQAGWRPRARAGGDAVARRWPQGTDNSE